MNVLFHFPRTRQCAGRRVLFPHARVRAQTAPEPGRQRRPRAAMPMLTPPGRSRQCRRAGRPLLSRGNGGTGGAEPGRGSGPRFCGGAAAAAKRAASPSARGAARWGRGLAVCRGGGWKVTFRNGNPADGFTALFSSKLDFVS